jgi:hypothetical protein
MLREHENVGVPKDIVRSSVNTPIGEMAFQKCERDVRGEGRWDRSCVGNISVVPCVIARLRGTRYSMAEYDVPINGRATDSWVKRRMSMGSRIEILCPPVMCVPLHVPLIYSFIFLVACAPLQSASRCFVSYP